MRTTHGDGNGYFPRIGNIWIPNQEFDVDTIWTIPFFNALSKKRRIWRESKNVSPATHSAIRSPPTPTLLFSLSLNLLTHAVFLISRNLPNINGLPDSA